MKNILPDCLIADCLPSKQMAKIKGGEEIISPDSVLPVSYIYDSDNPETLNDDDLGGEEDDPIWQPVTKTP